MAFHVKKLFFGLTLTTGVLTILALSIAFRQSREPAGSNLSSAVAGPKDSIAEQRGRNPIDRTISAELATAPQGGVLLEGEKQSIQSLRSALRAYRKKTSEVAARGPQIETLKQLAQDKESLRIITKALSSLQEVETLFGEDQALVRFTGIEVLRMAAELGQVEFLEAAINNTMMELHQGTWKKGRELDLTDLLHSWIEVTGADVVEENPALLFERFPYTSHLRAPVATALRYSLKERVNDPSVVDRFRTYLEKETI